MKIARNLTTNKFTNKIFILDEKQKKKLVGRKLKFIYKSIENPTYK